MTPHSAQFRKYFDPLTLIAFSSMLIICVVLDISVVLALLAGLVLFCMYTLLRGFSFRRFLGMAWDGVRTVKSILLTFFLIGILTAFWRASGCVPAIVCYASRLIRPSVFLLLTFLLNALVSVLTGTAFGTAATMGVICMTVANAMDLSAFWAGGAMLSGVFFGDRCSPVSTSALLVSTLTETDLYRNLRNMVSSALFPFLAACLVYTAVGLLLPETAARTDVEPLFRSEFHIGLLCLLPAACVLILALFRCSVRITMLAGIASAVPIALFVQHVPLRTLLTAALTGYSAETTELAALLNGGGLTSMLRVAAIVCIASCYSGIFRGTGILDFLRRRIDAFGAKHGTFAAMLLLSVPASAVACNQTLAIMLTDQLSANLPADKESRALFLEDSAVVIAPLIPWSIAGSVPLVTTGAPTASILAACYLYFLPLGQLFFQWRRTQPDVSV